MSIQPNVPEGNERAEPSGGRSGYSFRDPAGRVFTSDRRVFRLVTEDGALDLRAFLDSQVYRLGARAGKVVRTAVLYAPDRQRLIQDLGAGPAAEGLDVKLVLEHEPIPFPSYPYEWPPEMLHAAGELTLGLARQGVDEGLGLKDATPYNVLFRGPQPVFVDVLSVERRRADDPTWKPYSQFVRTFLLPLLVNQRFGLRLDQLLLTRREGLEPDEVYRMCGPVQRLASPFLTLVTLPAWLRSRADGQEARLLKEQSAGDTEKARYILRGVLGHLRGALDRVRPRASARSVWSGYMDEHQSYSEDELAAKHRFCLRALQEVAPERVLDVGCNTGHYSMLAAEHGASVVAIDSDPVVASHVWRESRERRLDVLPLVVDIARPSPAAGWKNRETRSFLERARGAFPFVMMLALIHHLLATERIPLGEIVDLAARLTTDHLLIEWVEPDDPMFRKLLRGRDHLFRNLNVQQFEAACARWFEVVRTHQFPGSKRRLYLLRRRRPVCTAVPTAA
jgi:SAM-dependent methyltransferase